MTLTKLSYSPVGEAAGRLVSRNPAKAQDCCKHFKMASGYKKESSGDGTAEMLCSYQMLSLGDCV